MQIRHRIVNRNSIEKSMAFIDIEGLDPQRSDNYDADNLNFFVDTYKTFIQSGKKPSMLESLLSPINIFLKDLSEDELRLLANFFIDSRILIDTNLYYGNSEAVAIKIGELFYDVCMQINIVEKLGQFPLPIPDLSNIGHRPQDRLEFTFHHKDYVDLNIICLLCKLLGPIWGDLIQRTRSYIGNADKETYCVEVISPLLSHMRLSPINKRFEAYVANIVKRRISRYSTDIEFIAAYNGFTDNRFQNAIYAILLVKRFVNVDLLREDCDVMKYVATCAEKQLSNQLRNLRANSKAKEREDVNEQDDKFESNTSMLEHDSRVSRSTPDIPVIVRVGINLEISQMLKKYSIRQEYFDAAMSYYAHNHIQPSLMNRLLISTMLGNRIGGAFGLQYLDIETYTKLAVVVQLYIAQTMANPLAHLITCTTDSVLKATQSNTDSRIVMNARSSAEYKNVEMKWQFIVNGRSIRTQLGTDTRTGRGGILDWIVNYEHLYNTAPVVAELMEDDLPTDKGTLVDYDEMLMNQLYTFMLTVSNEKTQYAA